MQIPCWSVSIESVTRLRWGFCQVQSLLGHSQFLEPWFQTSSYQSCVALTWQSWWLGGVGFFLGSWYSDKHWPEPSRLGAIWNFGPCFLFYLSLITSQVLTKIPGLCEKYWTKTPSNKMQTRVLSKIESSNDLLLTIDWMYDLDWELDMENSLLTYELRVKTMTNSRQMWHVGPLCSGCAWSFCLFCYMMASLVASTLRLREHKCSGGYVFSTYKD